MELPIDIALFNKLEACAIALASSVVEPICIPSDAGDYGSTSESIPTKGIFSSVFYYTENYGEGIIRRRIKDREKDILKHYNSHKEMLDLLICIEKYAKTQNRKEVSDRIIELSFLVDEHSDFIRKHQRGCGENSFLFQPTCLPGHNNIRGEYGTELSFNPKQTRAGIKEETNTLKEMLVDFLIEFKSIEFPDIHTAREGIESNADGSYRGNLELLVQQLKELNFELK